MTHSDEAVDPVMRGFGEFRFGEATLHLAACLRDGKGLDGSEACGAWLTLLAKRAYEDGWREAHRARGFKPPEPPGDAPAIEPASGAGLVIYTIEQAGEMLGLPRSTAYDAARRGSIPTIRVGRRRLVPKDALHKLLANGSPPGA